MCNDEVVSDNYGFRINTNVVRPVYDPPALNYSRLCVSQPTAPPRYNVILCWKANMVSGRVAKLAMLHWLNCARARLCNSKRFIPSATVFDFILNSLHGSPPNVSMESHGKSYDT